MTRRFATPLAARMYGISFERTDQQFFCDMWLMGCPNPYKMQKSWECTFLKVPIQRQNERQIFFYFPDSELPTKRYSHFSLNGLYWPLVILKQASEKFFWRSICVLQVKTFKKVHSQLFAFFKGQGSPSATCKWRCQILKVLLRSGIVTIPFKNCEEFLMILLKTEKKLTFTFG